MYKLEIFKDLFNKPNLYLKINSTDLFSLGRTYTNISLINILTNIYEYIYIYLYIISYQFSKYKKKHATNNYPRKKHATPIITQDKLTGIVCVKRQYMHSIPFPPCIHSISKISSRIYQPIPATPPLLHDPLHQLGG